MVHGDHEAVHNAERSMAVELFKAQFGHATFDRESDTIHIEIPGNSARVDWDNDKVTCTPADAALHARIVTCMERMRAAFEKIQPGELSSANETGTAI